MKEEEAQALIEICGNVALEGMAHVAKNSVVIPELYLDWIEGQDASAIGRDNIAIFVNVKTFALHQITGIAQNRHWIKDRTLAIRKAVLDSESLLHTGIIIHETGHAFNVVAGIANSERNAYIFEISVMLRLYQEQNKWICQYTAEDFSQYFISRMPQYKKGLPDETLSILIKQIKLNFSLDDMCFLFTVPQISGKKLMDGASTFFEEKRKFSEKENEKSPKNDNLYIT
jgi:hypothetical protein